VEEPVNKAPTYREDNTNFVKVTVDFSYEDQEKLKESKGISGIKTDILKVMGEQRRHF
jgi:hypothetical protein